MNTSEHDPIARWMKASQAPIPITDMDALVMAEVRAVARVKARQRRYLVFAWTSFAVGLVTGVWLSGPQYGGLATSVAVSVALVFAFDAVWRQSREWFSHPLLVD